jgi:hypothetical protein
MRTIKNVTYFDRLEDAQSVLDNLKAGARIVSYTKGFAIQKYKSGPYWNSNEARFV